MRRSASPNDESTHNIRSQRRHVRSVRSKQTEPSAGVNESTEFINHLLNISANTKTAKTAKSAKSLLPSATNCDFDNIHRVNPLTKTSASDTSVFLATIGRDTQAVDIAAKVFYTPVGLNIDNSLILEQENYKLMNQVVVNRWTPHLIAYVASFLCPGEALDNLPVNVRKNIISDLKTSVKNYPSEKVFSGVYNVPKQRTYSFLFTEQAKNFQPLKEWICAANVSLKSIKSVLFQALFTLEVFNRINFRHNDPHAGNVLIEDHSSVESSPASLVYDIDGERFEVPTKNNFVKLFDFDRSYFDCISKSKNKDVIRLKDTYKRNLSDRGMSSCVNTALENNYCAGAGECNRQNAKYDTFLMLKSLVLKIDECEKRNTPALKQTLKFLHQIIDGVPKKYIHNEPPKFPDGYWLLKGNQDYIPKDDEMPSTLDILQSNFFTDFTKDVKGKGVAFTLP